MSVVDDVRHVDATGSREHLGQGARSHEIADVRHRPVVRRFDVLILPKPIDRTPRERPRSRIADPDAGRQGLDRVADRTGHKSSAMINRYRRQARQAAELGLGALAPLDAALGLVAEAEGPKRGGDNGGRNDESPATLHAPELPLPDVAAGSSPPHPPRS